MEGHADLGLLAVKRENLRQAMERFTSQASELLVFTLQWSNVEEYIKLAEGNIEKGLKEVKSKEMELEKRSLALEERAKVVEAAEAELGDLKMKADGFQKEILDKGKELDYFDDRIFHYKGACKILEINLGQLKKALRECTVEDRSKKAQLDQLTELLRKTHVEHQSKGEQLAQLETDLERRRVEVSEEKENLDRNQTLNSKLDEEIERKSNDLSELLNKLSDYGKQLESVEAQLDAQQKELLERRSSEDKELKGLVEAKRNAILDLELTEETVKIRKNEIESKAKELDDIEKMIEERSAHYHSIKSLIKEHNEELASKEKIQNEITLEIASKEKTVERGRAYIRELDKKQLAKENKVDSTKEKLRSVKGMLKIKEDELVSLQSLIEEKNKQVEEGEKKMQDLDKSSEELIIQLQVKKQVVCSINDAIGECSSELESKRKERDQIQRSITDLTAELTSKKCDLDSVTKKIQDGLKDFQPREEEEVRLEASLMEREQELGLREKQFDARLEKIELEEKELDARQEKIVEKDQQLKSTEAMQVSSLIHDEKALQLLLCGHLKKSDELHLEVLDTLKASSDPTKLVLDTIQAVTSLDPISARRSSICLLECLMDMSPKPKGEVEGEAIKFAIDWKNTTLVKAENPVEVLGFLHFLAVFSLAYSFAADKVQKLFDVAFLGKYTPSLCKALGISALAPAVNNTSVSPSLDVQENTGVSQPANGNAVTDTEGSASLVSSVLGPFNNPRRLVLDYLEQALMDTKQRGELDLSEAIVRTVIPFLEEMIQDTKPIHRTLHITAARLANQWSGMLVCDAQITPLKAWSFLHFIGAYRLVDGSNTNQPRILQLAPYVAHFNQAPKLFQSLGLNYALPDIVSRLINERQYVPAIRFIFFFDLKITMFSPVEFLKQEINNLRHSAKAQEMIMVPPPGTQNQNQFVPPSVPVHMQPPHTIIHRPYMATHGSNPQAVTYQAGGLTPHQAGFKRPRVDPPGPSSVVRPWFNPPSSGYGRF